MDSTVIVETKKNSQEIASFPRMTLTSIKQYHDNTESIWKPSKF